MMAMWNQTVSKVNGHYQLPIPFKSKNPELPDAKGMAEKRLSSLAKKLRRDATLKLQYAQGMQDLLEKGYAVPVPEKELSRCDGRVWYLPHHPVINPNKDQPRIVFDCAAVHQGVSLNSRVSQGPDLTNNLVGVLQRFRQHSIAVMGDVEAMFHQVKVEPSQRDALRFLWWPDGDLDSAPKVYRMTVHLFGGTWSPSVCSFALRRAAEDKGEKYSQEAVAAVNRAFYVDDCLLSVPTKEDAIKRVSELKSMLGESGFTIKKWTSNHQAVIASIPPEERSKKARERDLDAPLEERALGVYWCVDSDSFTYRTTAMEKPLTKRGLLSMLSSVYDPLGFASPFILLARRIVQDLCRLKVEWDAPVPSEHQARWQEWTTHLQAMKEVSIPRCLQACPVTDAADHTAQEQVREGVRLVASPGPSPTNQGNTIMKRQLHHFADASEVAYGVVSYLRTTYSNGQVSTSLVMAKARLAPLKTASIPRLELCAATLATKQDELLSRELDLHLEEPVYWTDSTIVLWYIRHREKRFLTFVANRVSHIRGRTEPEQWRHIPTAENPADDASRGALPAVLADRRWQEGPAFLRLPQDQWPTWEPAAPAQDDLELKAEQVTLAVVEKKEDPLDQLFQRYSTWNALLRGTARVLSVMRARRTKTRLEAQLTPEHLREAERAIMVHVQQKAFPQEIADLRTKGRVSHSSRLARLSPELRNGLIVSTGRLRNANLPRVTVAPVVLPNDHHVVEVLTRHLHLETAHAGRDHVLAELRQRYWVVGATTLVKKILGRCVTCRRRESAPCKQQMADLPLDRLQEGGAAFQRCGVDYFGPFTVEKGRGTDKRYGCLFTCLASRAVHVEVAHSLSTSSFINCLARFMARRGVPSLIRSDNGRNFLGAERELRIMVESLDNSRLKDHLLAKGIEWRFNPPAASHMGGAWERMIRSIRRVLAGLTREQTLGEEELCTLLTVAEGIVNSRPITPVSADPKDLEALTPNHLLMLKPTAMLPVETNSADALRKSWKQVQYLADLFWKRWLKEYLPLLRSRTKWTEPRRNVSQGDIVLLVDHLLPRNQWKLGRVLQALPGEDGLVRVAKIKTQDTELTRPVSKLCLLEAAC